MSKKSFMCWGQDKKGDCPLRDDCIRFIRKPDVNQEYYHNLPYDDNGRKCDFYLPKWVLDELKTNNI